MTFDQEPIVGIPDDLKRGSKATSSSRATWHLPQETWRKIRERATGKGVTVAVLDTGYYQHPLLPEPVAPKSFIRGEDWSDPRSGHGTHCAGTVGARDENIGVAPDCNIMPVKVLSNRGSGSSSGIAAGVEYATNMGADIISMSLGGPQAYQPTIAAIKRAVDRGVWVFAAAGNSGFSGRGNTIGWPARSGQAVCVTALRSDGRLASFSSGGVQATVAAPGQQILSCDNSGSGLVFMSGTSMACPFAAGAAALVREIRIREGLPSIVGIENVFKFYKANCDDLYAPGHDPHTGYGQLDVLGTLEAIAEDSLNFV